MSTPAEQPQPEQQQPEQLQAAGSPPAAPPPGGPSHPFLLYNLARLALFAVALGVFYLVGFRGLALLLVALLVSGAISFVALRGLANSAGASFVGSWRRMNERIDESSKAEDDEDPR